MSEEKNMIKVGDFVQVFFLNKKDEQETKYGVVCSVKDSVIKLEDGIAYSIFQCRRFIPSEQLKPMKDMNKSLDAYKEYLQSKKRINEKIKEMDDAIKTVKDQLDKKSEAAKNAEYYYKSFCSESSRIKDEYKSISNTISNIPNMVRQNLANITHSCINKVGHMEFRVEHIEKTLKNLIVEV